MSTRVLQLGQSSGDAFLSPALSFADFLASLGRGDDVCGFTEVHRHLDQLVKACDEQGYQLAVAAPGDTALAVKVGHKLLDHGAVASVPAHGGDSAHRHTARPILWATIQPHATDEHVTCCEAHWITRRADTGGQQLAMTEDMASVVRDHAHGARLGFWMGDTNNPDRPQAVTDVDKALRKGELTSCWDELGRYPNTHGESTLDVVGSYDPDTRVSCLRARRWRKGHSDHWHVSAWYSIRPARVR